MWMSPSARLTLDGTWSLLVTDSTPFGIQVRASMSARNADDVWTLRCAVREELLRSGPVVQRLLRYLQSLITQIAHTAVCNRHHSLERQLCRWLLLCLDRQHGHCELSVTQELISNLLGVRREGVTESAQRLQAAGLIRYSRGHIAVLDRPGLEARACECYALLKQDFLRLLPQEPDGVDAATSATFAPVAVQA